MGTRAWRAANADRVRGYWRAYYYRNREKVAAGRRQRKVAGRRWLREYKASLVCADCGERHPATLDFHHPNAAEKELSIGEATRVGWSIQRLRTEIEKCIVLCANCHRKRHWTPEPMAELPDPRR
jgi:hypothetical protein